MKGRYAVFFLSLVLAIALAVPALGGPTNPVATLSAGAKSIALKALKKAKAAQSTANSALSAANTAQDTANSAEKNAKNAASTAATALTTAKTAQTKAEAAAAAAAAAQATANSKFGSTLTEFSEASGPNTTFGLALAECPAGSSVTGGGYTTSGTGANEAVPVFTAAYGNAWLADLERIPGQADSWSVTASVTCAKP
jgi:membrane protein involved in colicin uptake